MDFLVDGSISQENHAILMNVVKGNCTQFEQMQE